MEPDAKEKIIFDVRYKNASNIHDSRLRRIDSMQILRRKRRTHLFCLHRVSVDRSAAPQASLLLCYLMRLRSCGDAERDILALLIYNAMDDNLTSVLSKVTIDELFSVGLISTVVQCLDGGDRNDILRWCACGIIERIVNRNDVDDKYMNELNRWNLSTKIVSSMDTESRRQYECARSIISTIICKDNVSFRSFRLDVLVQLMNAFTRSLKTETADLINDVIRAMIDRSELISGWSEAILPQIYTLIIVPKQTDQTLESILRILLTITDGFGFRDRIDKMVNYGFIPFLIRLISWQLITVQLPALNLIKNISQSYDEHLYDLLNGNLLVPLKEILRPSEPKTVRHATLEILLNISGGHRTDVIAIISAGFLPIVLDIMLNGDNTSQLLSACIVNNFTNRGGVEEIKFMIDSGALDALCKILSIRNNNIIINSLDALNNIIKSLRHHTKFQKIVNIIEDYEGLSNIERLQQHENPDICLLAFEINENIFSQQNYQRANNHS